MILDDLLDVPSDLTLLRKLKRDIEAWITRAKVGIARSAIFGSSRESNRNETTVCARERTHNRNG